MNARISPSEATRALRLSDDELLAECDVHVFKGSGPGGQHRNKTESAVRLMHRPTQLVASATERRSQLQNRHEALTRLRATLVRLSYVAPRRVATRPTRGSNERRLSAKKIVTRHKANRKIDD